jgi:hypothetical protein
LLTSGENYSELNEQISFQQLSITPIEAHQKNTIDDNKSDDLVGEIQVPQSSQSSNIEIPSP